MKTTGELARLHGGTSPGFPWDGFLNRHRAVRRFAHNRGAVLGLAILLLLAAAALFAPFLSPYGVNSYPNAFSHMDTGPSLQHWLGTDSLGRDLYTRLLYGLRGPIAMSFAAAALSAVLGASIGLLAGYFRGPIDTVLNGITEAIFVIPGLLLLLLAVTLFGSALDGTLGALGRYVMITIILATDSWPIVMRLTRSEALRLRETQFIEAARVSGATTPDLIRNHLLPNTLGIALVQASLLTPSFLGATFLLGLFGILEVQPDVGQMILYSYGAMNYNPVEVLAPTTAVTILIVSASFVADGLRDAFDTSR